MSYQESRSSSSPASSEQHYRTIVSRIALGDETALRVLYDQTSRRVFGFAQQMLDDPGAAEEAVIDVYLDVWGNSERYDSRKSTVLGWIFGFARCRAIDLLRRQKTRKRNGSIADRQNIHFQQPDPEKSLSATETSTRLQQSVKNLSAGDREIIELSFWSELTHQEIAVIVKKPLGTVKSRIRRTMMKLKSELEELDRSRQNYEKDTHKRPRGHVLTPNPSRKRRQSVRGSCT